MSAHMHFDYLLVGGGLQLRQDLTGPSAQIPQPGEVGLLLGEGLFGPGGVLEDLLQHLAAFLVGFGDVVVQLLAQLETTLCTRHQSVCTRGLHEGRKLYIKQRYEDTQFQRAFKQSLMTALIAANVFRITKNPNDSDVLIIDVNTEYVRWAEKKANAQHTPHDLRTALGWHVNFLDKGTMAQE